MSAIHVTQGYIVQSKAHFSICQKIRLKRGRSLGYKIAYPIVLWAQSVLVATLMVGHGRAQRNPQHCIA